MHGRFGTQMISVLVRKEVLLIHIAMSRSVTSVGGGVEMIY